MLLAAVEELRMPVIHSQQGFTHERILLKISNTNISIKRYNTIYIFI